MVAYLTLSFLGMSVIGLWCIANDLSLSIWIEKTKPWIIVLIIVVLIGGFVPDKISATSMIKTYIKYDKTLSVEYKDELNKMIIETKAASP
jgi:hypothetical protein